MVSIKIHSNGSYQQTVLHCTAIGHRYCRIVQWFILSAETHLGDFGAHFPGLRGHQMIHYPVNRIPLFSSSWTKRLFQHDFIGPTFCANVQTARGNIISLADSLLVELKLRWKAECLRDERNTVLILFKVLNHLATSEVVKDGGNEPSDQWRHRNPITLLWATMV